jgi:hypothetical protein
MLSPSWMWPNIDLCIACKYAVRSHLATDFKDYLFDMHNSGCNESIWSKRHRKKKPVKTDETVERSITFFPLVTRRDVSSFYADSNERFPVSIGLETDTPADCLMRSSPTRGTRSLEIRIGTFGVRDLTTRVLCHFSCINRNSYVFGILQI